jgi:hypothetical protein
MICQQLVTPTETQAGGTTYEEIEDPVHDCHKPDE